MESDVLHRAAGSESRAYRLAEGTELLGVYQDSAFEQPEYLVQRADGQMMQLPELLYRVAGSLDGRSAEAIAAGLSVETGEELTAEDISFLVEERLRPVGLIDSIKSDCTEDEAPGGAAVAEPAVKSDPLLALRYRVGVVPAAAVWRIAGVFQPLFARWAWILLLAGFLAVDAWILARGGLADTALAGVQQLVQAPTLVLLILVMAVVSGAFHECGHITACRYGGARPGDVGVGLYIVWPSFYSTVTDSYRLNRAGRLRTDLGGVYFNAILMAGLGLVYLRTGEPWLLITLVAMHVETAFQFMPSIRFDGYYILADLIGVPDLFGYVKPTLLSLLPGRPTHPKVWELKPRARRTIVVWVLLVVPTLFFYLVAFLLLAPRAISAAWQSFLGSLHTIDTAARNGEIVIASLGVFQIFFLILPWVGTALILQLLVRAFGRWVISRRGPQARGRVSATTRAALRRSVTISALLGIGTLLVARVVQVALSRPATVGETRLIGSAGAVVHGASEGPSIGAGEFLARGHFVAYARLNDAFGRHETVLAAGRELAVAATAVLVGCLLMLVWSGRVRPLAAALPLLAALAMGPVVTTLATISSGILAAAWTAVGAAVLATEGRRATAVLGILAVGTGVATAPLIAVPLVVGVGALLIDQRWARRAALQNASYDAGADRFRQWSGVALVVALGVLGLLGVLSAFLVPGAGDAPIDGPQRAALLLTGGLVGVAGLAVSQVRASAAAACSVLLLAAPRWAGAAIALPVAVVMVTVVGVLLIGVWTRVPVEQRPHPLLRAALAVPVLVLVVVGALLQP